MAFLVKLFPFILAWVIVKSSIRTDEILFLQKSSGEKNEILLVMTWTENKDHMTAGCEIFTDEKLINEILSSNTAQIRTLHEYEMQILLADCQEFNHQRSKRDTEYAASATVSEDNIEGVEDYYDELSRTNSRRSNRRRGSRNRTPRKRKNEQGSKPKNTVKTTEQPSTTVSFNEIEDVTQDDDKWDKQKGAWNRTWIKGELDSELEESFDTNVTATEPSTTAGYDGLPIIFPGTKWCGAGAIAQNYDDLGTYEDTDKCCRAHDLCNDILAPGETRNGLTNTSPFTKLCCRCDEDFYNCLENVHSVASNTIGNMYFNLLRRECYMIDHPPSKICKTYLTLFKLTCLEYEKDTSQEKVYQWIKPKRYTRIRLKRDTKTTIVL